MGKKITMCGLVCNDCLIFIATQKNDDTIREKAIKAFETLETWFTGGEPLKLKDMNCEGCLGKRLFKFCSVCAVRKCGLDKGIENCAYCDEFSCGKLKELWSRFRIHSPEEAKARLKEIRARII